MSLDLKNKISSLGVRRQWRLSSDPPKNNVSDWMCGAIISRAHIYPKTLSARPSSAVDVKFQNVESGRRVRTISERSIPHDHCIYATSTTILFRFRWSRLPATDDGAAFTTPKPPLWRHSVVLFTTLSMLDKYAMPLETIRRYSRAYSLQMGMTNEIMGELFMIKKWNKKKVL